MDGLAVVVVGIFVALPAALILLLMVSTMAVALGRPHPTIRGARIVQFAAPLLAAVYPLIFVILGDRRNAEGALFFDLPLIALGVLAFILACLVVRKHDRSAARDRR